MNRHIIPVEQLHEFATAGNAVCTIKSKSTGQHRTIKIINAGDSDFYRVYIRGEKWIELGRFRATTPAVNRTTVSWFLRVLSGDISLERADEQAEFWHEGQCAACGRQLTDPVSIATGFGPICSQRRGR